MDWPGPQPYVCVTHTHTHTSYICHTHLPSAWGWNTFGVFTLIGIVMLTHLLTFTMKKIWCQLSNRDVDLYLLHGPRFWYRAPCLYQGTVSQPKWTPQGVLPLTRLDKPDSVYPHEPIRRGFPFRWSFNLWPNRTMHTVFQVQCSFSSLTFGLTYFTLLLRCLAIISRVHLDSA